ncbi:MAG: SpoIIE family protein phosphatase, partial [Clostridia bacterium]|nr:SpoIIE family protein phosphatase [Clostridia bacterium]
PAIGFPAYISNSDYGWLCSAGAPVYAEDGSAIAYAMIDISMDEVMANREEFLKNVLLIMAASTLLFALVFMWVINRMVVKPINSLAFAASSFVSDHKAEGESSAISQLKIRTSDEIQNLAESVQRMELDINQYIDDLESVTAEKERIGAELDIARHIQASMLPCIFPAFPDRHEIDIYATMDPAKEVGGDFYDFFMVDERHLAIVMADVSGKGVPAALFMVIGKTLIKDHTTPGRDLGQVFTAVNNLLCEANSEGLFITAFEGVLDLVTGEFNFVNAGHEMPFICKAGGEFEAHKLRRAFVLAGMEDMRYRAGSMTLEPGDKIFQYTDGVTEATNAQEELYGMDRLHAVLNRVKDGTPHEILPAVKKDIDAFVGEAPQFDDITMLCLEYKARMEQKEDAQ